MLRILVLCYEYPPLGGGGGRVAKTIAEGLAARGHEVRVQTAGMGHLPSCEKIAGVEVFRTFAFRRYEDRCSVPEMGWYCATSFWPTLRHLRTWRPDVIHAHFAMPTGALAWAVHRLRRTPYVITAHLGDVPGGVPEQTDRLFRFVDPVARRVWGDAGAVTAVSSFVQELAERAYGRSVRRILNGIQLDGRAEPSMNRSAVPRLVFVGRLNPQKCPVFLVEVLARLTARPWKLTVVGDGELMPEMKEKIARYGLTDRITLTGWLDGARVQRILAEADIFLLPSTAEGLPVAAVEALKHGLAIVASDIPGTRDVVAHGVNGLRLPVGEADAWVKELDRLFDQPAVVTAMRRASWEKAREFDLEAIVSQYEEVLRLKS